MTQDGGDPSTTDAWQRAIEDAPPASRGLALYALITFSVVLASVDERSPWILAALVTGQALSLSLAHGYAESVAHRVSLWAGVSHALPVLLAAAPSVVIGVACGVLGLDGETAAYAALLTNLVGLVGLQWISARRVGLTRSGVLGALALDVVAVATVVVVIAYLK